MNVTIDIKLLAFGILALALVILIVYLIQLARKLIVTVDHTNKILEDVEVVSEIAANRSKDVDEIISNVSESVSSVTETMKEKQNIFTAVASIVKAVAAVKNAASDEKIE